MKIVLMSTELLHITKNPIGLIETAGRICYKSNAIPNYEEAKKFVQRLIDNKHFSVLEHCSATFRIICDRGISHAIVRHRIGAYSQESTIYCNYSKDRFGNEIQVIQPFFEANDPNVFLEWKTTVEQAERKYFLLLAKGEKPSVARSILPTCLKTELIVTYNFRQWLHFLWIRLTSKNEHPQMREIALQISEQLQKAVPVIFDKLIEC